MNAVVWARAGRLQQRVTGQGRLTCKQFVRVRVRAGWFSSVSADEAYGLSMCLLSEQAALVSAESALLPVFDVKIHKGDAHRQDFDTTWILYTHS